jgi:hypothetical protein
MKTRSVRWLAACCGLLLTGAAVAGCRSRPAPVPRDEALEGSLEVDLGFRGRKLAVDFSQKARVDFVAKSTRLMGDYLVLLEEPNRIDVLDRDTLMMDWTYHALPAGLRYLPTLTPISMLAMSDNQLHEMDLRYGHARGGNAIHFSLAPSSSFGGTAGTAYVPCWGGGSGEKTLRTINLVTGLEGWGYRTPGDIRSGVVVGGEPPRQMVYFATDLGEVYGLPAVEAAGRAPDIAWSCDTRGPVTAPLELSGDEIFVSSQSGFLYCLDRITGGVKWAAAHETPLMSSATATKGSVYQHRDGALWCHDRSNGKVRWKLKGGARLVAERDGKSLVEMDGGKTLLLVAPDGAVVGRMSAGPYYYPTNTRDDSIYAVSEDGLVFKLENGGE